MPNHGRGLAHPLKRKKARFSTEERKAVTCCSVGGTEDLLSQGAQKLPTIPAFSCI
jgi:hypothetical protein